MLDIGLDGASGPPPMSGISSWFRVVVVDGIRCCSIGKRGTGRKMCCIVLGTRLGREWNVFVRVRRLLIHRVATRLAKLVGHLRLDMAW